MSGRANTSPEPRIATGSVYHPPEEPYPRLLIMRRWPRGVAKRVIDRWERDLGPSRPLLEAYRAGDVPWDVFAHEYRTEVLEHADLLDAVATMATTTGVTLLCSTHPYEECHRSVLEALLRERIDAA